MNLTPRLIPRLMGMLGCLLPVVAVTVFPGCQGVGSQLASKFDETTKPIVHSWNRVQKAGQPEPNWEWNWESIIPQDVKRADLVNPIIAGNSLGRFVGSIPGYEVALASTDSNESMFQVVNIEGQEISNCQDLFHALAKLDESKEVAQIDLAPVRNDGSLGETTAVNSNPESLQSMFSAFAADQKVLKVSDGGNTWLIHREEGIQLEITGRLDRRHGILQTVLTITNCGQQPEIMPFDVIVRCNGQALQCLSVADTLERIYGAHDRRIDSGDSQFKTAYSEVSKTEDYLIPSNFKQLEQAFIESFKHSKRAHPSPALLSVGQDEYPGSAILGDARALTNFMMRKQLLKPGDELTGWIMFGGDELESVKELEIEVETPSGRRTFLFLIPG